MVTLLKKELHNPITEYEKLRLQFHDLGATSIVQGSTLKSMEDCYESFIGNYVVISLQDDGRTLKILVDDREEEE